ncbi:putative nitroreductase [Streptomyces sp. MBT84]|jgi:deazaflavin-dependent oxidoreductase (nitroreductase family)|uniref:nitroreductase/quinone reductase family protein n=1 Tax=unclassified Streptomyces TaxID=2593676 RepID=UPI0007C64B69|nr:MULTISPECIES: nitroreductase/quinone reductase family protein [unclassified Streptomyces]MBW8698655.1 putative nitroreductase [Streptomyces sp. MBT84]MDX3266000.1 nitroreductase/quinone reductase family protein [Streptomyces sp. MI02-2A]REE65457.1 deazaflavin-dependent oxidoreductase (nitroreductase family) [Streptomyces sp. 3212.3]
MADVQGVNERVIDEFRCGNGAVGGRFEGAQLLLLHTVGRRTGRERVNPLVYAADGDGYLVCGSARGAENDPAWVANVAAMSEVTIEVGERVMKATPTVVLHPSPEWERLYGIWSAYWTDSAHYEAKTSRKFPIVRLQPVASAG